jgi:pimeloyl-ACP methyl ester carboxylesterase
MEKQVRFCTAADGVRIAYATYGPSDGYPLIFVPGWVSHLEIDEFIWDIAVEGILEATENAFRIARYDKRGTGLSQRGDVGLTVDDRVKDIDAVADALKWRRFALDGVSEGGPVVMAYAARNPRRVSHLIVYGSFASFHMEQSTAEERAEIDAVLGVVESSWGVGASIFTARLLAGASVGDTAKFTELQRQGASAKDAAALLRMNVDIDIVDELPNIKAPTLVVHGKQDQAVPIELGREIAQRIPNAQFFAHGGGHYPASEYRQAIFGTIATFLRDTGAIAKPAAPSKTVAAPASAPVTTVIFTDIERNTEILQRLGDAAWRKLLREHETITREQRRPVRHGCHDGVTHRGIGVGG